MNTVKGIMMQNQLLRKMRASFDLKTILCVALVALCDFLFYEHPLGWLTGLFSLTFLGFLTFYYADALCKKLGIACVVICATQALVMIHSPNLISAMIYLVGASVIVMTPKKRLYADGLLWVKSVVLFLLSIFSRLFVDLDRVFGVRKPEREQKKFSRFLMKLTLPFVLTGLFIILFAVANPIIGQWFDGLGLADIFAFISIKRWVFWLLAAMMLWPFLRPFVMKDGIAVQPSYYLQNPKLLWLFNHEAVLISLGAFNALFFAQTGMDAMYLWGGVQLPEGLTYARYAQQGAYPLIVTALLAAVFVLVALRSHYSNHVFVWVKRLIYLWITQNIFMVISAILRANLYVEEYSLTYLRFAAFIWMGIVAAGLFLILVRMACDKSNAWLINTNLAVVLFILLVSSFLNIGSMIAQYNVRHCREVTGRGTVLDTVYLKKIGTSSLPALEWINNHPDVPHMASATMLENELRSKVQTNIGNWRSWTLREYLLSKPMNSDNIHENVAY